MTPRRVLTWTFGLRTPFNPMSNAATNGGDATSTGREGLQQVRLAKSLPKKLGGSSACAFGPPCLFDNPDRHTRITNRRRAGCSALAIRPQFDLGALKRVAFRLRFDRSPKWLVLYAVADTGPASCAAGLATLLPRLGVTPRGRNAADGGRLTANQRPGASAGGVSFGSRGRNSLANSKRSGINSAQRA